MNAMVIGNSSTKKFAIGIIALLFLATVFIGISYWKLGFLNPQDATRFIELNSGFKEISSPKFLERFSDLLKTGNIREGIGEFDFLSKKIEMIESSLDLEQTEESVRLRSERERLKDSLSQMLSLPDFDQVQRVLKTKVSQFNNYLILKNYPTLKKSSEKILEKLSDGRNLRGNEVLMVTRFLKTEQEIMQNAVSSSRLTIAEKEDLANRVKSLDVEISVLEKIGIASASINKSQNSIKILMQDWNKLVGPKIAEFQLGFNSRNKLFSYYLLGFILLTFISMGIFAKGAKIIDSKSRILSEQNISQWLKKGLVKDEQLPFMVGPELTKDFDALKSYVLKRIQFSSSFQEALPFASILLDNNLKVIWANDLFCEAWKLNSTDVKTQGVSWDYLRKITNLGTNDPVIESFQKSIPGIFQIQVRPEEGKMRIPYEMYLSPIGDGANRKMMIFFYPLISLEETISNQAKALIAPIESMLNKLNSGPLNQEIRESLAYEFEVAGISFLFEKFSSFIEAQMLQRQGLLSEIDNLETQVSHYQKIVHELNEIHLVSRQESQEFRNLLQRNRGIVVGLANVASSFDQLNQNLLNQLSGRIEEVSYLSERGVQLSRYLNSGAQMISVLGVIRNEVKKSKESLGDSKARLLQTIDQAILFHSKSQWEPHQVELTFNRIKTQVREFDEAVIGFEKQVGNFDVSMSKLKILLEEFDRGEKINPPNLQENALILSSYQEKYLELNRSETSIQEDLVSSFEEIAAQIKSLRANWEKASYLSDLGARMQLDTPQTINASNKIDRIGKEAPIT